MLLKINNKLNKGLSLISAVVLIVMMVHILAHALGRYFFSSPIYGTNEIVQYWYLPLVALLGIPAAQLQKQHITVTLVTGRMAFRNAAIFKIFAALLGAAVSGLWTWYGFQEALRRMEMGATAGVTDIVIWPIYFLVPITFLLLAALYVIDIIAMKHVDDPEEALISDTPIKHELSARDVA